MRTGALLLALGAVLPAYTVAAADSARYHNYDELTAALKSAAAARPDLVRLASIGRTREGRELWAIELAKRAGPPVDSRPALLVAANLEGDHLIGSALALRIVEHLLNAYADDASVRARLDESVLYVVPRVNPDGAEQMFAPVQSLRRTNATPFDADNDGRTDEDGPEDLNGDGVVTVMRVRDPKGPYMLHPDDARLMKRADPAKGEAGGWAIHPEGVDNDGDGFIDEDGAGGTDLNRNFLHRYPYHAADAGRHMASEPETRAMLEYVLRHRNIAAILTFGESDNLVAAPGRAGVAAPINLNDFAENTNAPARRVGMMPDLDSTGARPPATKGASGAATATGRSSQPAAAGSRGSPTSTATGRPPPVQPATTVNAADVEYFTAIANKYRELTGLRSTGYTRAPAGAFHEYGYFQYGVPSFSTPGWGLPEEPRPAAGSAKGAPEAQPAALAPEVEAAETTSGRAASSGQRGSGRGASSRGSSRGSTGGTMAGTRPGGEAAAPAPEGIDLRLLRWMDREKVAGFVAWTPYQHPTLGAVEIGGFKPYLTVNPPVEKIAALGTVHAKFVVHLMSLFPRIKLAKSEVTALGGGLYRIKADVENTGYLPTALAHGVVARAVKPVMVQLGVRPENIIAGAEKTNSIPALAGSGNRASFEWVIKGQPGSAVTLKVVAQKAGTASATLHLP